MVKTLSEHPTSRINSEKLYILLLGGLNLLFRMYAYMLLVSMILLEEVVVLFMVDGGVPLQPTMLSIDADNDNRGGCSCQEAERRLTVMACSQAAAIICQPLHYLTIDMCSYIHRERLYCLGPQQF